jgi:HSP20 family protein
VNIFENKEAWTVEAEMPGVNREGLEILLEGNELTLVGHKTVEQPQADVLYRECADRDYRRSFVLDPTIDTANISARVENGILRLNLPKAEKVKPRKIVVE